MNGKDIIRALLRGGTPERLAWAPCIDPYTRSGLPSPLREMDIFELQHRLGSDLFRGASAVSERFDPLIRHTRSDGGEGSIIDVYETPKGTLREVHTFTPESPYIPFPTEHLIKNFDDLDAYLCLLEHTVIEPDHVRLAEAIGAYPAAMISVAVTDTPMPVLMTKLIGTEIFVYMHDEDPARMRRAMESMQARHRERIAAAVSGPGEVFISYENTNTNSFGVRWIRDYEIPHLNEYADIIHAAGKHLLVHMCGRIQLVIDDIAAARFDGVIDIAAPPTGDCDIPAAVRKLGARGKILGGGIDCTTFVLEDPDEFERRVQALVDSVGDRPSYLLGSGDAVPQGVSEENLQRAAAIARNRSPNK